MSRAEVASARRLPFDTLLDGPARAILLLTTAALYLWRLDISGWANAYYSAAAQAGSVSGAALFYGSSDAANSITVDKTPAALWLMVLSVRLFGLSSWAILLPQALAGVASVGLLYATVRRWYGPAAGLLAGTALAFTPVAALMFRFNNPDALLVLLLVLSGYATVRAVETASTGWIALAGVFVGFGFLTKMLQALLVVPALAGTYFLAAATGTGRRFRQLLLAGLAIVVSGGWWVAIVELVPANGRPYIGGSQTNSVLELTFGYNGLDRITEEQLAGAVGGGEAGWLRLFGPDIGGQFAWLLPAALILLTAGLVVTAGTLRTDRIRSGFVLWGGWLLVTGVTFSLMQGVFTAYYTVALAPAVAALVGMGTTVLWQHSSRGVATATVAGAVGVTAIWSWVLLGRTPDWQTWLRPTVLVTGLAASGLLVLMRRRRWTAIVALALGSAAAFAGPLGYSLATTASAHAGTVPVAGPTATGVGASFYPVVGPPRADRLPPGDLHIAGDGDLDGAPDVETSNDNLLFLLLADADDYTWVAATAGARTAADYQLATRRPVMAVGGFDGSGPFPTLEQFQHHVWDGEIHYFLGSPSPQARGGGEASAVIAAWVARTFTATSVEGVIVYDLSPGANR
jgi:4-amino-4-deoxy-L-arabinose transferase-like glycosyltransferase